MLSALMIFGTRPELIKLGPVYRALKRHRSVSVDVFWSAKRPVVITGRGARGASAELKRLLDATGAPFAKSSVMLAVNRAIVPGGVFAG